MKRIEIGVGPIGRAGAELAEIWRRAEGGERLPEAVPRLEFATLPELLAALTPKRLALLEALNAQPERSIRALAARLARDYKNVHGDVTALLNLGLIERDAGGVLFTPYDELVIHAPLRLAA